MKANKLILFLFFLGTATIANAQRSKDVVINDQNIITTISGSWVVTSVQPGKVNFPILAIEVKGPGYGNIKKLGDDQKAKDVIAKIMPLNNSSIVISDAEGFRQTFKVVKLGTTEITISDGTNTIMLAKQ